MKSWAEEGMSFESARDAYRVFTWWSHANNKLKMIRSDTERSRLFEYLIGFAYIGSRMCMIIVVSFVLARSSDLDIKYFISSTFTDTAVQTDMLILNLLLTLLKKIRLKNSTS